MKNVQEVQQTIKDMGFEAYSLIDWLDEIKKTAGIMQAVLGIISGYYPAKRAVNLSALDAIRTE